MRRKRIWVDEEFSTKIKHMAIDKGVTVVSLTKNIDFELKKDCYKDKRKKRVFTSNWVNL